MGEQSGLEQGRREGRQQWDCGSAVQIHIPFMFPKESYAGFLAMGVVLFPGAERRALTLRLWLPVLASPGLEGGERPGREGHR